MLFAFRGVNRGILGGLAFFIGDKLSQILPLFPHAMAEALHAKTVLEEHHPAEGGGQKSEEPEDFGDQTHVRKN